MPLVRSEPRQLAEHGAWSLALLVMATLFLTSQALDVALSERLLVTLLIMLLMGQLGMLFGAALDFGAAGLVMLAGWCTTLGGSGLGSLWVKLGIAPWSYAGMLIGCNLGMLLSGCLNRQSTQRGMPPWLFLSLSNLGMLLGLLAIEAWQPAVSGSLQNLAVLMVLQMLLAMAAGMIAIWWLSVRVNQLGILGTRSISGSGG